MTEPSARVQAWWFRHSPWLRYSNGKMLVFSVALVVGLLLLFGMPDPWFKAFVAAYLAFQYAREFTTHFKGTEDRDDD